MDEKPIYNFGKLKTTLIEEGFQVEKAEAYRAIKPVDVSIEDIKNGTIEITSEGIFFKTKDGRKHPGFMYKRKYRLARYGKPRFHIRNCTTIQEFKSSGSFESEYRWANEQIIPVIDMDDNNIDKVIQNLPLCKNCAHILRSNQADIYTDNEDFVNELKKVSVQDILTDVDILGYTREWQSISLNFREKRNYTCEHCGLQITNEFDKGYIHCHHRDGDKTNNDERNLECLCVLCHSHVDKIHQEHFSSGANATTLRIFCKKYHR